MDKIMTITISIDGPEEKLQEWYEELNTDITKFCNNYPEVFFRGLSRIVEYYHD